MVVLVFPTEVAFCRLGNCIIINPGNGYVLEVSSGILTSINPLSTQNISRIIEIYQLSITELFSLWFFSLINNFISPGPQHILFLPCSHTHSSLGYKDLKKITVFWINRTILPSQFFLWRCPMPLGMYI